MVVFEEEVEGVHMRKILYIRQRALSLLEMMRDDLKERPSLSEERRGRIEDTISLLGQMESDLHENIDLLAGMWIKSRR